MQRAAGGKVVVVLPGDEVAAAAVFLQQHLGAHVADDQGTMHMSAPDVSPTMQQQLDRRWETCMANKLAMQRATPAPISLASRFTSFSPPVAALVCAGVGALGYRLAQRSFKKFSLMCAYCVYELVLSVAKQSRCVLVHSVAILSVV